MRAVCAFSVCATLASAALPVHGPLTGTMDVQGVTLAVAKRSAGDAAAQEAVDDMLAEQDGAGDADGAPQKAADEAEEEEEEEDLDEVGAESS